MLHVNNNNVRLATSPLGEAGKQALYSTGKVYGAKVIERYQTASIDEQPSIEQKINILKDAGTMLGMYPDFEYDAESTSIIFKIKNCPFREVICIMHF